MKRAAVLAALSLCAAAPPPALRQRAQAWEARGYSVKDRAAVEAGGVSVAAAVYAAPNSGGDKLEAYLVSAGKARLGFSHPFPAEKLEIDASPAARWTDLLGDGSRVLAYRAFTPALGSSRLRLLRYRRFKFSVAADLPEGTLQGDGRSALLVAREQPLGRHFLVGCEEAPLAARRAFRSRLYVPRRGRLVEVTGERPDWFRSEVVRKEEALKELRGDEERLGEYVGLAISLYYDHEALGEAARGWSRLRELVAPPPGAPAAAAACYESARRDLGARLGVPGS